MLRQEQESPIIYIENRGDEVKNRTEWKIQLGTETLFSFSCIEMRQFRAENQERQIDRVLLWR